LKKGLSERRLPVGLPEVVEDGPFVCHQRLEDFYKAVNNFFIELTMNVSFQLAESFFYLHCLSVWAVIRHGIIGIHGGQNPGKKRNIRAIN
jgi:hypothetical protein